jgi:hypothetical protein
MQITIWEIADCWSEEEILKYQKELLKSINILNKTLDLKIERLQKLKIEIVNKISENETA